MKSALKEKITFYLVCLALLIGLIVTYSNHFNNPFHFDDDHTIVSNVWIRSTRNIPKFFTDGTTTSSLPSNQAYRPGLTTLNTIDYAIASKNPLKIDKNPLYLLDGLNPFYYHLDIFICFILQAVLMFLVFRKILDLTVTHQWNKYFALFMVALYCFHTATAETINYIISRSDGFSTLMVLLSLYLYIYFPAKRKFQFYLLPYIAGFFVKEPTLMLSPILFVYIALFEKQIDLSRLFSKENWRKTISAFMAVLHILLIGAGLYLLSFLLTPKTWLPGIISRWDYLITQPFVMVQYFKTFLLPTELSADTDWKPLTSIFSIKFILGLMFVAGMIWLAFRVSRRKEFRPLSFGIFWFFIALIPSSSIIPLSEVLNDHRVFFPYIGLVLGLSWILIYYVILKNEKKYLQSSLRFIVPILAFALITGHAYGTYQRNKVWSSYESLWYDVTQKSPWNGRGLMNYGLSQMRIGNLPVAKEYFEKALKITPNYSLLHINMGVLLTAMNDPIGAEMYFKNAIALNSYPDQAYYYYGNFLKNQKRYDEAIEMLKYSVSLNPAFLEPRRALMAAYFETEDWGALSLLATETLQYVPGDAECIAYIDAGKNKKTKLDIAKELVTMQPNADNYLNLSLKYYEAGLYQDCIDACYEAIKIKPDFAAAYNNICSACNELKQYDKAIEACNKAIALQPDFELAKNNLKLAKNNLK
jgi:protein O-mannosyl-transferase